jgi:DDE superfamily endonuclease
MIADGIASASGGTVYQGQGQHVLQAHNLLLTAAAAAVCERRRGREWWILPRSTDFWENIVLGDWVTQLRPTQRDREYVEEFRMSYPTFNHLCELLEPYLERQDTPMRPAISVKKRVAIALYRLAHTTCFKRVARLLACGRSTAEDICAEVNEAIVEHLRDEYVSFPTGDRLRAVMSGFESKRQGKGLPMVAGAVDGSHIPYHPPDRDHADFCNRKGWYSILLQGCVDDKGLFTDFYVGWPGRAHDARVWKESPLYAWARDGDVLRDVGPRDICGQPVYPVILGDAAYPCDTFCLPPFKGRVSSDRDWFNEMQSSARQCVECAFGRLKSRFRILTIPVKYKKVEHRVMQVAACCILHNFVEMHGEHYDERWEDQIDPKYKEDLDEPDPPEYEDNATGNSVRDAFVQYMSQHKPEGWVRRPGR